MGLHWADRPKDRREWYLRLAIAAAVTAAKIPVPMAKAAYLKLARQLEWEAEHMPGDLPSQGHDSQPAEDEEEGH